MRHENDRDVDVPPDFEQIVLHLSPGLRVERPERFVHEQNARLRREGSGDRHTLLHASGKLSGIVVRIPGQPDDVQPLQRDVFGGVAILADRFQPEHDVPADGQPGEERVLLKDHPAFRTGSDDRFAVQQNFPGSRRLESGQNADQRRLSAAGGTDDREELPLMDLKRNIFQDNLVFSAGSRKLLEEIPGFHDDRAANQPGEPVTHLGTHHLFVIRQSAVHLFSSSPLWKERSKTPGRGDRKSPPPPGRKSPCACSPTGRSGGRTTRGTYRRTIRCSR